MKAVLVIDLPIESLDNVVAFANVYEQKDGYRTLIKRTGKMKLIPMPSKLDFNDLRWCNHDNIDGWNACLEEITE